MMDMGALLVGKFTRHGRCEGLKGSPENVRCEGGGGGGSAHCPTRSQDPKRN